MWLARRLEHHHTPAQRPGDRTRQDATRADSWTVLFLLGWAGSPIRQRLRWHGDPEPRVLKLSQDKGSIHRREGGQLWSAWSRYRRRSHGPCGSSLKRSIVGPRPISMMSATRMVSCTTSRAVRRGGSRRSLGADAPPPLPLHPVLRRWLQPASAAVRSSALPMDLQ